LLSFQNSPGSVLLSPIPGVSHSVATDTDPDTDSNSPWFHSDIMSYKPKIL